MKSEKPTPQAGAAESPAEKPADVALVRAVSEDGSVHVIRRRGERLEAGSLQPLREGAPIRGEVVSLRPRPDFPLLCDVDVHYAPPQEVSKPIAARRKGPAQVATDSYRDNWDSIWSRKKTDALN